MAKWLRRPTVNRKIPSSTLGGEVSFFASFSCFVADVQTRAVGFRGGRSSCQSRQGPLTAGAASGPTHLGTGGPVRAGHVPLVRSFVISRKQHGTKPRFRVRKKSLTRNHNHGSRLEYCFLQTQTQKPHGSDTACVVDLVFKCFDCLSRSSQAREDLTCTRSSSDDIAKLYVLSTRERLEIHSTSYDSLGVKSAGPWTKPSSKLGPTRRDMSDLSLPAHPPILRGRGLAKWDHGGNIKTLLEGKIGILDDGAQRRRGPIAPSLPPRRTAGAPAASPYRSRRVISSPISHLKKTNQTRADYSCTTTRDHNHNHAFQT